MNTARGPKKYDNKDNKLYLPRDGHKCTNSVEKLLKNSSNLGLLKCVRQPLWRQRRRVEKDIKSYRTDV